MPRNPEGPPPVLPVPVEPPERMSFRSWRRSELAAQAVRPPASPQQDGTRLVTAVTITLTDDHVGVPHSGDVHAVLRSAADVIAFTPTAIRKRVPASGVRDAEETKWTHIDFHAPDLPWRYSPVTGNPDVLAPWVVLIVAKEGEFRFEGNLLTADPALLSETAHVLDKDASARWAHVQDPLGDVDPKTAGTPAGDRFSRLVNTRPLEPMTNYTAFVVRAFADDGTPMWNSDGKINGEAIPVLDSWPFTTGEGGDFATLAAALHVANPNPALGHARLDYRLAAPASGVIQLATGGALTAIPSDPPNPPDPAEADLVAIASDIAALAPSPKAGDPEFIDLPLYGAPWVELPPTQEWGKNLRADVRYRVDAGTGVRMGIAGQEDLVAAAVQQTGDLRQVAAQIAHLATGLHLAGRLWDRALPSDDVQRLRMLGGLSSRLLVADSEATVADVVTGPSTNLFPGVFSSAGQRLLGRAARGRGAGAPAAGEVLTAIDAGQNTRSPAGGSRAELAERTLDGIAAARDGLRDVVDAVTRYLDACLEESRDFNPRWLDRGGYIEDFAHGYGDRIVSQFADAFGGEPCDGMWERAATAAGCSFEPNEPGYHLAIRMAADNSFAAVLYGPIQTAILLCRLDIIDPREGMPVVGAAAVPVPAAGHPLRNLGGLSRAIATVVDPRRANPPGLSDLSSRVDSPFPTPLPLTPPRFPLGIDYPTWSLLRKYAPEWLLPGSQTVENDSITALQTNPAFIDAFLVGVNRQFASETRWRRMPTDPWGTPLGMFFGPVDRTTGLRTRDIKPISAWDPSSALGAPQHQSFPPAVDSTAAERLVILVNSPIFRRYPNTLIYLHSDAKKGDDLGETPDFTGIKPVDIAPSFPGTITPDLHFFVFDVAPASVTDYWVMLDEPPTELRFKPGDQWASVGLATTSAQIASDNIDPKIRVAIDGATLWKAAAAGGVQ